jgi:hypothetical protein
MIVREICRGDDTVRVGDLVLTGDSSQTIGVAYRDNIWGRHSLGMFLVERGKLMSMPIIGSDRIIAR